MSNVKWGLIGPGRIAQRFAGALSCDFVGTLHAVASRDRTRAQAFADQYGAAKVYEDYQALVLDIEIDAIYIATPHAFHYQQAKLCLEAGKPVLCEKPLCVTAEQSLALINIAKANHVFLMEAMWSPFLPIFQQVKHWIDSGEIGAPKFLQSTFGFAMPRDEADRWLNPNLAGGVLLDMGVYNVAISNWVFGEAPEHIVAQGIVGESGVDELVAATMRYSKQRYAQFTCNFHTQTDNSFWINGDKGRIRIEPMFWDTTKATLIREDKQQTVEKPFASTGFEYEIAEAERCIAAGATQSSTISHDFTLDAAKCMDTILQQLGVTYPDKITQR